MGICINATTCPADVNIFKKNAQQQNLLEYIASTLDLSDTQYEYITSLLAANLDKCKRAVEDGKGMSILHQILKHENQHAFDVLFEWSIDHNCLPDSWLVSIITFLLDGMVLNIIKGINILQKACICC